jgi:hypothetical protein
MTRKAQLAPKRGEKGEISCFVESFSVWRAWKFSKMSMRKKESFLEKKKC